MADNTVVSNTDTIRDLDRPGTGIKTQASQLDFGGPASDATGQVPEQLVSFTNPLPISQYVQLLADTWDGPYLDQVNKWALSAGGGGAMPVLVPAGFGAEAGALVLSSGTVANGWSAMQSIPFFSPTDPGHLFSKHNNNFEFPLITTGYRFWGFGIRFVNPVIGSVVQEGFGWEITTSGVLRAVCYAAGAVQVIATVTVPIDGNPHKYFGYFRGDLAYWCYDTLNNVVARMPTGALGPIINTLPWLSVAVSNGGTAVTITNNGTQVSDTAHTTFQLADGQLGFRKVTIKAPGVPAVAADNALVVTNAPGTLVDDRYGAHASMAQLLQVQQLMLAELRALNLNLSNIAGAEGVNAFDLIDENLLNLN